MKITRDFLESGKSVNGSWSKAQLECLEVWPLTAGWQERLIGKEVNQVICEMFLKLKDKHVPDNYSPLADFESFKYLIQEMEFAAEFIDKAPKKKEYSIEDLDLLDNIKNKAKTLSQKAKTLLSKISGVKDK